MEIVNSGDPDMLLGAAADIARSAAITGITLVAGEAGMQEVGAIEIPHGDFDLDPGGFAIVLEGLTTELPEGGEFELAPFFRDAGEIHLHVEIEAADARRHSHAGHAH